jgi:hypothetical protein
MGLPASWVGQMRTCDDVSERYHSYQGALFEHSLCRHEDLILDLSVETMENKVVWEMRRGSFSLIIHDWNGKKLKRNRAHALRSK